MSRARSADSIRLQSVAQRARSRSVTAVSGVIADRNASTLPLQKRSGERDGPTGIVRSHRARRDSPVFRSASGVAQPVSRRSEERGAAGGGVEGSLERGEALEQMPATPVDGAGPVADEVLPVRDQRAQLDPDLIRDDRWCQVPAHPRLVSDDRRVLRVASPTPVREAARRRSAAGRRRASSG